MKLKKLLKILIIAVIGSSLIFLIFFFSIEKNISNQNSESIQKRIVNENTSNNIMKGIKFSTVDNAENIYEINSKYGEKSLLDDNIIILYEVYAKLKFKDNKFLEVTSGKAEYNTLTNYTNFSNKVLINHKKNKISCNNLILDFSDGFAYLKNNVVFENLETKIIVDQVEIDLKKQTSKLNMFFKEDKIKIISKNEIN